MNRSFKLLAVVATALLAIPLLAAPASANVSQGFVAGASTITDDWGDEGVLSTSSHANSGATGLWQWVLYADGAKESNGTAFDMADVDFDFGPNTLAATKSWQSLYGLTVTDALNTQDWSRADNNLTLDSDNFTVLYHGKAHTIFMFRNDFGIGAYSVSTEDCYGTPNMGADYAAPDWADATCD